MYQLGHLTGRIAPPDSGCANIFALSSLTPSRAAAGPPAQAAKREARFSSRPWPLAVTKMGKLRGAGSCSVVNRSQPGERAKKTQIL